MNTELLLFAQIVGEFDDVKELYEADKPQEAYKLFLEKLEKLEESVKPESGYEKNGMRSF